MQIQCPYLLLSVHGPLPAVTCELQTAACACVMVFKVPVSGAVYLDQCSGSRGPMWQPHHAAGLEIPLVSLTSDHTIMQLVWRPH